MTVKQREKHIDLNSCLIPVSTVRRYMTEIIYSKYIGEQYYAKPIFKDSARFWS